MDSNTQKLLRLLTKYETLFDRTLGDWKAKPIKLERKPDVTPVYSRAFPVPHIHKETFYKKLKWMVTFGILRKGSD